MQEIVTYRLVGTGVWGYEFFDAQRNQIGFVRNGMSNAEPAVIEGEGISWYSRFGLDYTIVPGTSRRVKDNQSGEELYRIIFWQPGMYEIRPKTGSSILAEIREGDYLFGPPQVPAAAVTRRITEAELIPPASLEIRPYFRTQFFENVNPLFQMLVLSFPALRMY